jgi:hypothetical protein
MATKRMSKEVEMLIKIPQRSLSYVRVAAFNRFCDNVERALKGDKECKANLLAEDLADAREYFGDCVNAVRNGTV